MSSAGDYTVLKNIIAEYSFLGGQAWTTATPIITTNTTNSGVGSGSIVTLGGISVAKNLFVGGTISGPTLPSVQSGISTITTSPMTVTIPIPYINQAFNVFATYVSTSATAPTVQIFTSTTSVSTFLVWGQTNPNYNFNWATMGQAS